ncbi:hypothetical protein F7725_011918 [Dissostichus mawsoni]|uniref:Ubiquitin-like protease family profile domain-containing protein n=1 Tax=Dissostichus mawsoni TaxID=36200 RepID=A0A7J5ZDC7_DISMA|nr:hypothetical protein F7725_011918 [Dissostichus mawsoni]
MSDLTGYQQLSCDPPSFSLTDLSQMQRTRGPRSEAKCLKRKKGFLSLVKGISPLPIRAKKHVYSKLQLWMWRKRREKCFFGAKKRAHRITSSPLLSVKTQPQENKVPTNHTPKLEDSDTASALRCDTGASEVTTRGKDCLLSLCESVSPSETLNPSSSLQNQVKDTNVSEGNTSQTLLSQKTEALEQLSKVTDPLTLSQTMEPVLNTESDACSKARGWRPISPHHLTSVAPGQNQFPNRHTNNGISSKSPPTDVRLLAKDIQEFLEDFYRIYGSFIPLQKRDVLRHLKRKFNTDFSGRKNIVFQEVTKYQDVMFQEPVPCFQVLYKKHTLTLEDLSTLADQNWLNDQVMNMYGELIMESAHHKVHFLNSFFHRQLMTKGYDGVKRWTKQVDLFSKSLLLVPIHLEVHWCLVTADIAKKKICLYDSQGNALQKVARNILKYLMVEARERKQTDFESGWAVSYDEKDIPKIRKRIYKELCNCALNEQG